MQVTQKQRKEVVTSTYPVIELSVEEVENIIKKVAEERGHKVTKVNVTATYKYVTDDWGMNGHYMGVATGATIYLKEQENGEV